MLKLLIAISVFVYVAAQHNNHCVNRDDCPDCAHSLHKECLNHFCECLHHTGGRSTCHSNKECDATCPDGQNGVCNSQNHCECGNHGKRAGETCQTNADCDAVLTCDHGGSPTCEKHTDTHDGHCHCKH